MKSKGRSVLGRAMGKKMAIFTSLLVLFSVGLCFAGDLLQVIIFDGSGDGAVSTSAFETVYRGEVSFSHGKHVEIYRLECGRCHHDDNGEPLNDTDLSGGINRCADCHFKDGLLRGQALAKASEGEILEHYPNAMHKMCIGCHKERNNRTHTLFAPEACRGCHATSEGNWPAR